MDTKNVDRQHLLSLAESVRHRMTSICKQIDKARTMEDSVLSQSWLAALKAQRKKNNQLLNKVDLYVQRNLDTDSPQQVKAFLEEAYQLYRDSSVE